MRAACLLASARARDRGKDEQPVVRPRRSRWRGRIEHPFALKDLTNLLVGGPDVASREPDLAQPRDVAELVATLLQQHDGAVETELPWNRPASWTTFR